MKKQSTFRGTVAKTLASACVALGFLNTAQASTDYGPAIWRPVCNGKWYSSGYGKKFFVEHDMEGYYLSGISYIQRCDVSVSIHYAVSGKVDCAGDAPAGEVSQLVSDHLYAWHARCWNQHCMGTEHEGFRSNPAWYTPQLYDSSATLTKIKAEKYSFAKDRNHIIGHDEHQRAAWRSYASANLGIDPYCNDHNDPGPYWDWTGFMNRINASSGPGPSSPNPVLIPNTDGRLEAFAVWSDNSVVHNWQTAPNSGWFGWDTLTGNGVVKVAAGRNLNGNLVAFCIGGTSLYQNYWNGSNWSGWQLLGGSITDLSVVSNADGRLEVFTANTDGSASHIWQNTPNVMSWSGWSSLSGNGINRVATARQANGYLVCFVIGGTGLYQNAWNGSTWPGWQYMGGSLTEISVISHTNGRLELFSRNTDGSASHIWQNSPNGSWSGWDSLGGNGINKIAIGRNQNGNLEVFCTGGTTLYHNWWTGSSWYGWQSLGGTINSLAVGSNLDGRLEVFARQVADGQMIHIYQNSPNGAWSSWYGMGGSFK